MSTRYLAGVGLTVLTLGTPACASSSRAPGQNIYPLEVHQNGRLKPFRAGERVSDFPGSVACVPAARAKAQSSQQLGTLSDILLHLSWLFPVATGATVGLIAATNGAVAGPFDSERSFTINMEPIRRTDHEEGMNAALYTGVGGSLTVLSLIGHFVTASQSRADMLDAVNIYNDLAPGVSACDAGSAQAPEAGSVPSQPPESRSSESRWLGLLQKPVVVLTAQGSAVVGTLTAVTDNVIVVKTEDGDIPLPVADVRNILPQKTL